MTMKNEKSKTEEVGKIAVDPPILFIKPGAISDDDKAELKSRGVIVIEVDDPAAVKLIRATPELPSSELLALAGKAIGVSEFSEKAFGAAVANALAKKH